MASRRFAGSLVAAAATLLVAFTVTVRAGQVIRSSTDLISIDVQVVDKDGNPVSGLTKDEFEIEIGGKRRPVQLVELIRSDSNQVTVGAVPEEAKRPGVEVQHPVSYSPRRQTFMLAVDAQTFSAGVSRGVIETSQKFIRTLSPTDAIGLYAYPLGPKVEPTTDRAALVKALDQVSGQKEAASSYQFNVRNSEIVDYFTEDRTRRVGESIVSRYCGQGDRLCESRFNMEMTTRAGLMEAQAHADLGRLRDLINGMATIEGRKVLVLASAGLTISDRPGGRPDVGNLPIELGEACARANVALYTLYIDNSVLEMFSAERRQEMKSQANIARDADVAERWLDMFSGAAGGALIKVLTNNAETAFARIARETSSYYLLGVTATDADRTGHAQQIKVRVSQKGATVRSRAFVVMPKP